MKKIILIIIGVLVLIQFIKPEKNNSKLYTNDISTVTAIPSEVKQILETSCSDCHSNNTIYPWYSEFAPVSWYLASHVNDGKEHLNFSEWTAYNKNQQNHILKELKKVLKSHEMPLKSYLIIHENAIMTAEQFKLVSDWVKTIKVE